MKSTFNILLFLLFCINTVIGNDSLLLNIADGLQFNPIELHHADGLQYTRNAYFMKMDKFDNLWIGSNAGLFVYDGVSAKNYTNLINRDSVRIKRDFITGLELDMNGDVWFGTTEGLYHVDVEDRSCSKIAYPRGVDLFYVRSIAFLGEEVLIGTIDGIYIFDQEQDAYSGEYLTNGNLIRENDSSSKVWFIYADAQKNEVWFTTRLGLQHLNRRTDELVQYKIPRFFESPYHSFIGGYGTTDKLVIASYSDGLIEFDRDSKSFTQTNSGFEQKGEQFSRFKSIVQLSNEISMVNAEYIGLGLYNSRNHAFHWLQYNDLIQRGDYNIAIGNHGYVWFSTEGQLFRSSRPIADIKSGDPISKNIKLSRVVANGEYQFLDQVNYPEEFDFGSDEKNLEFIFGLPYDDDSLTLKYEYSLDNDNWIEFQEIIRLYNLKRGDHQLRVRAMSAEQETVDEHLVKWNIHQPILSRWYIRFFIISALIIGFLAIRQFFLKKERDKKKMAEHYERKLHELESQALRSQINPHFIFNTLNSIKYYSIAKTPEETSDFISDFSLLIRQILENSKKNLIPLKDEIETLESYIRIENMRFKRHFEYEIVKDSIVSDLNFLVPPMIIQPFVENAIWHGLMHKED